MLGEGQVVTTHDGDVVRDPAAKALQLSQHTDRHFVALHEHGCRARFALEQDTNSHSASGGRPIRFDNKVFAHFEPGLEQMLHRHPPRLPVVVAYERDPAPRDVLECHGRHGAPQQAHKLEVLFQLWRSDDYAIDPALEEHLHDGGAMRFRRREACQQDGIAPEPRLVLYADGYSCEGGVGDVTNDKADRVSRLAQQAPRQRIGQVAELACRLEDALSCAGRHSDLSTVQDLAGSLKADPRTFGNIPERRILTGRHTPTPQPGLTCGFEPLPHRLSEASPSLSEASLKRYNSGHELSSPPPTF